MTLEQIALIRLLQIGNDYVESWRSLFQGAMIRAKTAKGRTATVRIEDIEALQSAGLIVPGYGGSFCLTDEGRAV